jgi:hypothetical protein
MTTREKQFAALFFVAAEGTRFSPMSACALGDDG